MTTEPTREEKATRNKHQKPATARQRRQGAEAEAYVRRILYQLPKRQFSIFNDIRAKYGNIDHLVINRHGKIFLIETKSHRGKVTYDGKHLCLNGKPFRKNPIAQVARNIKWLRTTIENTCGPTPWITGIIVFTNASIYASDGKKTQWMPVQQLAVLPQSSLIRTINWNDAKRQRQSRANGTTRVQHCYNAYERI